MNRDDALEILRREKPSWMADGKGLMGDRKPYIPAATQHGEVTRRTHELRTGTFYDFGDVGEPENQKLYAKISGILPCPTITFDDGMDTLSVQVKWQPLRGFYAVVVGHTSGLAMELRVSPAVVKGSSVSANDVIIINDDFGAFTVFTTTGGSAMNTPLANGNLLGGCGGGTLGYTGTVTLSHTP